MKKVKKKNKLKNFFFINEKQIIFSIIIIILLFINKINSSNTGNNSEIIKFKIDGEIIISNKNIIENNQLNSPLILLIQMKKILILKIITFSLLKKEN